MAIAIARSQVFMPTEEEEEEEEDEEGEEGEEEEEGNATHPGRVSPVSKRMR
jgi:hypothetical protein